MMLTRAKRAGKQQPVISLPHDLFEKLDIIYILAGQPEESCFYVLTELFQKIDLVKFFDLVSYMMFEDMYIKHLLHNFTFAHNKTVEDGLFYAHKVLGWSHVCHFLVEDMGIELPMANSLLLYKEEIQKMENSNRLTTEHFTKNIAMLSLGINIHSEHNNCPVCYKLPKNRAMAQISAMCRSMKI